MSFLLFAHRKLSILRNLDHKNFRLTIIDNKLMNLHEQQGIMAQAKSSAQSSLSIFYNSNVSLLDNFFNTKTNQMYNSVQGFNDKYSKALEANGNDENAQPVKDAKAAYDKAVENANTNYRKFYSDYMKDKSALQMSAQAMNSIFTNSDQNQASFINAQEKQMTIEKANLESQVKILNEELSSVKTAEDQAAKRAVTDFGLGGGR